MQSASRKNNANPRTTPRFFSRRQNAQVLKRRLLPLALACILLLSCAPLTMAQAESTSSVGLYSETIIPAPTGFSAITSMTVAPNGAMLAAAMDASGAWSLLIWQDATAQPEVRPLTIEGDVSSILCAPDGQIAIVPAITFARQNNATGGNPASAPDSPGGIMMNPGGQQTQIVWLDSTYQVAATTSLPERGSQIKALSGRQIASIGYQSGITIYDETGKSVRTLNVQNAQDVAGSAENIYVLTTETVLEFIGSSSEKSREVSVEAGYSGLIVGGLDGKVYVKGTDGLFQIDPSNWSAVKVMNLAATLLGDPSSNIARFGVLASGVIAVLATEGSGMAAIGGGAGGRTFNAIVGGSATASTMALYTRSNATATGNTLVITAMYDSVELRKAVSIFSRQHPEITVDLRVEMSDGDTSPVEDHIRTLNTNLLAGKGGDVLILDGLPLSNYVSKGILKNLTSLANELDLIPGVRKGSEASDGNVYVIPAKFSFSTLWGRAEQLSGAQSLDDLLYANLNAGQSPFAARTPEEWLRLFYPEAEAYLRDSKGSVHFNTPEFEQFLEVLYSFYSTQGDLAQLNLPNMGGGRGQQMRNGMNPAEMLSLYNGVSAFCPMTISGLMQLSTVYSLAGGTESAFVTTPGPTGPATTYTPTTLAGINARSTQQALAEEFLRVLLSEEVQEADQMSSLPTTKTALDKLFADAEERSTNGNLTMRMAIQGGVSLEVTQPTVETWRELRSLCDTLDTPVTVDETLMGFLVEETAAFFEGRQSASGAAQAVEQRAFYYLNE